jgi:hypothetical protein
MRCFTWSGGCISKGIALTHDERLGQVVYLGETGRGRWYEKIALCRHQPAEVVDGRVLEAFPKKITLAAKPDKGMKEKTFYVLQKPRNGNGDKVLVRIRTLTSYIRGASGRYTKVEGEPETLIAGYGAFGAAGRVGSWDDGLVVMKAGDVLRVYPSRGQHSYALWLEDGVPQTATWQDYQNLRAVEAAQEVIAEAEGQPEALDVVFGSMPCYTYVGRGEIQSGLKVSTGTSGSVVSLGESGRGRKLAEVPIVGFSPGERLDSAAVAKLSEEEKPSRYYGDEPEIHRIYGLTESQATEDGVLVRVQLPRPHRSYLRTKALRGEPTKLAGGIYASGAAGRAGSVDDTLWVLRKGDSLVISSYPDNLRVIENQDGKLTTTSWKAWELTDAQANPEPYVAKGKAPWGHVPAEWIGRVVQVIRRIKEYDSRRREYYTEYRRTHEGELISVSPLVVNLGWDGRDRKDVTVENGVWVKIDPHKTVTRPNEDEVKEREEAKAEADTLQAEARELREQPHFSCFERGAAGSDRQRGRRA